MGYCIQAGGWATQHEVNGEAIKPEIRVGLDPTKILDKEAILWKVVLVTACRPKRGGAGPRRGNYSGS